MSIPVTTSHAAFEAFIALPENAERHFELIHGEIVEKMPTHLHGVIVSLFVHALMNYLEQSRSGHISVEARFKPDAESEQSLIPDIAYTILSRGIVSEGAMEGVPDLAIEVQSPNQSDQFMVDKARIYLTHGCPIVWLIYPKVRLVEVLTPTDRALFGINDTLTGGEVLPAFSMPVARLFERL